MTNSDNAANSTNTYIDPIPSYSAWRHRVHITKTWAAPSSQHREYLWSQNFERKQGALGVEEEHLKQDSINSSRRLTFKSYISRRLPPCLHYPIQRLSMTYFYPQNKVITSSFHCQLSRNIAPSLHTCSI